MTRPDLDALIDAGDTERLTILDAKIKARGRQTSRQYIPPEEWALIATPRHMFERDDPDP